jgi:periplasmic divalent cation tolerance protein
MTDMILIYITCADVSEAKKIGKYLLDKKLCACINIFDGMNSLYFWPPKTGKLEEAHEAVLLVKTLSGKFELIEKEVLAIHVSDTPCLIAIPTTHVSKKYLEWIKGEMQ